MSDRRRASFDTTSYISGSAARQIKELSSAQRKPAEDHYEYARPRKEQRVQEAAIVESGRSFSFLSLLVLTAALLVGGAICVSYLSAQSEIQQTKREILDLEKEIAVLQSNNAIAREQIEDSVSLKKIYMVATKQLGMVHPKKDQVISFKDIKSNFVRQYGEIPKEDKGVFWNVLENNKK